MSLLASVYPSFDIAVLFYAGWGSVGGFSAAPSRVEGLADIVPEGLGSASLTAAVVPAAIGFFKVDSLEPASYFYSGTLGGSLVAVALDAD